MSLENPPEGRFVVYPNKYTPPADGTKPIRVYTNGVFDTFHHGHARLLKHGKELFPNVYLIVGVTTDEDTTKMKGKTLMNELERAELVYHCRYVDQLIVRSPWVMTQEYLDEHQIDFVVHGDDNSFDENGNDAYAFIKSLGKYTEVPRTDGISTTDLITRILKDYHGYIVRCMRRGFTHTDLNIPDNVWAELQQHIKVDKKYGA